MPLVEALPFEEELRRDPPSRLGTDDIVIPADVDLTLIGTAHDGRFSVPDYAHELLRANQVLFYEAYKWDAQKEKRLQRVSKGYPKAMEETRAIDASYVNNERASEADRGLSLWEGPFHEALYRSGIRVVMADYPAGHEAVNSRSYLAALGEISKTISVKKPVKDEVMVEFSKRDAYIVRAICAAIPRLRQEDPKLKPDKPIKALAPYGAMHVNAIADALSAAAAEQGVESFTIRTQYELITPNPEHGGSDRVDQIEQKIKNTMLYYQDWLRAKPRRTRWHS